MAHNSIVRSLRIRRQKVLWFPRAGNRLRQSLGAIASSTKPTSSATATSMEGFHSTLSAKHSRNSPMPTEATIHPATTLHSTRPTSWPTSADFKLDPSTHLTASCRTRLLTTAMATPREKGMISLSFTTSPSISKIFPITMCGTLVLIWQCRAHWLGP